MEIMEEIHVQMGLNKIPLPICVVDVSSSVAFKLSTYFCAKYSNTINKK